MVVYTVIYFESVTLERWMSEWFFHAYLVLYMGASESKREEDHKEQLIRNVKIALVGTYGVGKTSIITRYIDQKFSSEYIYTRGKWNFLMRPNVGYMDNLVEPLHGKIYMLYGQNRFGLYIKQNFFSVTGGNIRKKSIKVYGRQIQIELM